MKKLMITAVAVAALATPALAQSATDTPPLAEQAQMSSGYGYGPGYDSYASVNGSYARGPAVYSYGHYSGWDPDPAIRGQLRRDPINSGNVQ